VLEPKENLLVSLYSFDKGFQMNEEMAGFLLDNPDVEVQVGLVG
jgi:DNA polymerase-3 subunit alpha